MKSLVQICDTLLVVGNGCDLNAGLKSKFIDFYRPLIRQYKNYCITRDFSCLKNVNIWYLIIFIYYLGKFNQWDDIGTIDWLDIEKVINETITSSKTTPAISLNYIEHCCEIIRNHEMISDVDANNLVFIFIWNRQNGIANAMDYLYKSLIDLERDFDKYLSKELSNNIIYKQKINRIIENLINPNKNVLILNFNYTSISDFYTGNIFETHIHGKLGEQIIFGIDAQFIDPNRGGVIFSKSYRKMINLNHDAIILPKNVKTIKLYGHSLGEQDYSYFLALFNYYDIQNKTDLYFYYTPYKETEEENKVIKSRFIKDVYSLIEKYGCMVFGKDNGKNLLTRLLLENRIHIDIIDKLT